jgi:hypothetical protein
MGGLIFSQNAGARLAACEIRILAFCDMSERNVREFLSTHIYIIDTTETAIEFLSTHIAPQIIDAFNISFFTSRIHSHFHSFFHSNSYHRTIIVSNGFFYHSTIIVSHTKTHFGLLTQWH